MNNHRLSVFTLAMLITVSIDSIRNLPTMALFGSSLIFFFIFSAIVFLIPLSLVCAELFNLERERRRLLLGENGLWGKNGFSRGLAAVD
jgi:hypothetical protein